MPHDRRHDQRGRLRARHDGRRADPGLVKEGARAIWQLDQVRVLDGGADSDADTAADNSLFVVQGVFVP